jgi:hypothetical protein
MRFRADANQDLAAVRPVEGFAGFRTEGKIVVDAAAKGLLGLGKARVFEGYDIAKPEDATDEDPLAGLGRSEVALAFDTGVTPPPAPHPRRRHSDRRLGDNRSTAGSGDPDQGMGLPGYWTCKASL